MAKKNFTLAVANAKGGSGKSTIACCLAAELAHRGQRVTLIDADPAGGTRLWHGVEGPLHAIPLILASEADVTAKARAAAQDSIAIIDAAGFADPTFGLVLGVADMVLIPCRASALDAYRAIETVAIAKELSEVRKRRIPVYVVLNAVQHTAITPHIRAEIEGAKVKVLQAEIGQRTAFAVAALSGTAPCWMGAPAEKAAAEVAALANELDI